ncbi:MAG: RluA family pseudouridine synthase [Myxococcota bacterium]
MSEHGPEDEEGRGIVPDGELILAAKGGLLVVNKPAGIPSTGRSLDDPDCLQSLLMKRLGRKRLWAIHQLDAGTTGINLFCTRKGLVSRYAERLQQGRKIYLAICHGQMEEELREVELPLGRKKVGGGKTVPAVLRDGKPAHTTVRRIGTSENVGEGFSLVEVELHTGRTHQARLHLAAIGLPLVGERLHRKPPCRLFHRHALHAWRLLLPDRRGDLETLEAPFPEDMAALCDRLELPVPEGR